MNTEWTDEQLDGFWDAHMNGRDLPPRMHAAGNIRGPQLIISDGPLRAIWTREKATRRGRHWHKIIVVG